MFKKITFSPLQIFGIEKSLFEYYKKIPYLIISHLKF